MLKKSAENLAAEEHTYTFTKEYLKKLTEEKPCLEHYSDVKNSKVPEFDTFLFQIKDAATKLMKQILEGEDIDMDITNYLCYLKDGTVHNVELLNNILNRIEEVTEIEYLMKAKLTEVKKLLDLQRWDQKHAHYLKYYLKEHNKIQHIQHVRSELLQKIRESLKIINFDKERDIMQSLKDYSEIGCEVNSLKADQTILYRPTSNSKEKMNHIKTEIPPLKNEQLEESYPKANFMYNCMDKFDINSSILSFRKAAETLDSCGMKQNIITLRTKSAFNVDDDQYDEELAEIKYLQSKPTCFIIVGKECAEIRRLARKIADYWGCIHID
ncbi:hypothetical protein L9F63_007411, partial [Diploptera punctata]